jgi:hypothetical protein
LTWSKQPHRYNGCGGCDGEEHFQNRKEGASKNGYQGQTLPLRQVSQKKPETCENSRSLVLSQLPKSRQIMTNHNKLLMLHDAVVVHCSWIVV